MPRIVINCEYLCQLNLFAIITYHPTIKLHSPWHQWHPLTNNIELKHYIRYYGAKHCIALPCLLPNFIPVVVGLKYDVQSRVDKEKVIFYHVCTMLLAETCKQLLQKN